MTAPKILIYAFTLRRDAAAAILLKSLLERRGAHVVIACGYNFERYLKWWKPDTVLISTISKLHSVKNLAPKSKVVLWPGEGGEPDETSNANMLSKRSDDYDKIDMILSWGEHDKIIFEKYFPGKADKVLVCGNPRLDMVKCNPHLKKLKETSRSIGFICRFNSLNHYDGRPTIFSLNDPSNLEPVMAQAKSYVLMVETIKYLTENTDYDISIRPHPLEAPENYIYLQKKFGGRIHIDDSIDIAHWMAKQKVICSPSSTSFLEAYLTKTPIINIEGLSDVLEYTKQNQAFAALSSSAGEIPKSFGELHTLLENPPKPKTSDNVEEHLKEVHGWYLNGAASLRMAEALVPNTSATSFSAFYTLLNILNRVAFERNRLLRNKLFSNFNYCEGYHKIPRYFSDLISEAEKTS